MSNQNIQKLIEIMQQLRNPVGGCPWDLEQNHQTLKAYLIEETYEVLDAIDQEDPHLLKEELGDLLLQVIFHAQIAADKNQFTINDVAEGIVQKMIRRHPHVFDTKNNETSETVLKNWEAIKQQEKLEKGIKHLSLLDAVPQNFPALLEGYKISKKAAQQGFDWEKKEDVLSKVFEELSEFEQAVVNDNQNNIEEELGDLLFTVVNLCRVYKKNPEIILKNANQKFRHRFKIMEKEINSQNLKMNAISSENWNQFWNKAKKITKPIKT